MAVATAPPPSPSSRLDVLLDRLAELQGQRNVIDGQIVEVIAERAADGSDEHYAELAESATVSQLRTAIRLAPRPDEEPPRVEPERSVTKLTEETFAEWRIRLPHVEAAVFDAALQSHLDALVAEWRRDHGERDEATEDMPPFPTVADAFMRLVESGWDADVAARPHGHRTTVVLHVDVGSQVGSLHLGPAMSEAERRYLSCDSLVETWFERDGVPIGCGRETRQISRRLRRALEHRHPATKLVPPGACGPPVGNPERSGGAAVQVSKRRNQS